MPIGAVLVVAALIVVPEPPSGRCGYGVDSLLLSAIAFGLLVFAIIEGSALGWREPLALLAPQRLRRW